MASADYFDPLSYLHLRELGKPATFDCKNRLHRSLYSHVSQSSLFPSSPSDGQDWGAVFGFGFSPDGSVVAAACEKKCLLLFDSLNHRLITRRLNVHNDCVNCVKFLDNRLFATCSDDTTVRLWDTRCLKQELRILRGHSSWVKNIEYDLSSGKLITSGFDGNIYSWDINNYSERKEHAEPLLHINKIMRTVLTPARDKMIISVNGYFLLIHNLDLSRLREDMRGFQPHLYRLLHVLKLPVNSPLNFNYMFTRARNRVEFIGDFPRKDCAGSISSMEVHPHGWCVASRNTTVNEDAEWTCVHDIQAISDKPRTPAERAEDSKNLRATTNSNSSEVNVPFLIRQRISQQSPSATRNSLYQLAPHANDQERFSHSIVLNGSVASSYNSEHMVNLPQNNALVLNSMLGSGNLSNVRTFTADSWERVSTAGPNEDSDSEDCDSDTQNENTEHVSDYSRNRGRARESNELNGNNMIYFNSLPSTSPPSSTEEDPDSSSSTSSEHTERNVTVSTFERISHAYVGAFVSSEDREPTSLSQQGFAAGTSSIPNRQGTSSVSSSNEMETAPRNSLPSPYRFLQFWRVKRRLLYYLEESNVGLGFIKELSFSRDGRILASPYGNCVRLLAFNDSCHELCDTVPRKAMALTEVALTGCLKHTVLASTFSPTHCALVAGCRDGSISFCSPKL